MTWQTSNRVADVGLRPTTQVRSNLPRWKAKSVMGNVRVLTEGTRARGTFCVTHAMSPVSTQVDMSWPVPTTSGKRQHRASALSTSLPSPLTGCHSRQIRGYVTYYWSWRTAEFVERPKEIKRSFKKELSWSSAEVSGSETESWRKSKSDYNLCSILLVVATSGVVSEFRGRHRCTNAPVIRTCYSLPSCLQFTASALWVHLLKWTPFWRLFSVLLVFFLSKGLCKTRICSYRCENWPPNTLIFRKDSLLISVISPLAAGEPKYCRKLLACLLQLALFWNRDKDWRRTRWRNSAPPIVSVTQDQGNLIKERKSIPIGW